MLGWGGAPCGNPSVTCEAMRSGKARRGAVRKWWTSAHQSTELSGGLGGARRPLGGVRRGATPGAAARRVAKRSVAARCEGLGLTPLGCPCHYPSSFGASFPARFNNRSWRCAPCVDAAMNECTLIRF